MIGRSIALALVLALAADPAAAGWRLAAPTRSTRGGLRGGHPVKPHEAFPLALSAASSSRFQSIIRSVSVPAPDGRGDGRGAAIARPIAAAVNPEAVDQLVRAKTVEQAGAAVDFAFEFRRGFPIQLPTRALISASARDRLLGPHPKLPKNDRTEPSAPRERGLGSGGRAAVGAAAGFTSMFALALLLLLPENDTSPFGFGSFFAALEAGLLGLGGALLGAVAGAATTRPASTKPGESASGRPSRLGPSTRTMIGATVGFAAGAIFAALSSSGTGADALGLRLLFEALRFLFFALGAAVVGALIGAGTR